MAPLADRKVITAKCPLPVVTRHAAQSASRSVVIERLRRSHLKSLSCTGTYVMTIITTQSFVPVVLRMTEANAKSSGHFTGAHVTPWVMTNTARGNLLVARLRLWAVTLVASDVRVGSRRNRHSHTAATGPMTSCTTNAAQSHVARVIEFHIEASETGKCFERSRLRLAVADGADRIRRISKLLYVTTSARQVIRASGNRGTR